MSIVGYLAHGFKQLFAEDITQMVSDEDQVMTLSVASMADRDPEKNISSSVAAMIVKAYNDSIKNGENLSNRIENGIKVSKNDRSDRTELVDETIAKVEKQVEIKSANEVENIERARGGKEREEKIK